MENNILNTKVGQLVRKQPLTASVFRKANIDFCCGGDISIAEACARNKVDADLLSAELMKAIQSDKTPPSLDFDGMSLSFLIDYIYNVHHKYLYNTLPEIEFYVNKVTAKHGEKYLWLAQLHSLYHTLSEELKNHLPKEENILFPKVKEIEEKINMGIEITPEVLKMFEGPIKAMYQEHDGAGEIIHELSRITNNYTPPEDACNSHLYMLEKLKELHFDLTQHIHLENNILFPKIVALQEELQS